MSDAADMFQDRMEHVMEVSSVWSTGFESSRTAVTNANTILLIPVMFMDGSNGPAKRAADVKGSHLDLTGNVSPKKIDIKWCCDASVESEQKPEGTN